MGRCQCSGQDECFQHARGARFARVLYPKDGAHISSVTKTHKAGLSPPDCASMLGAPLSGEQSF